MSSIRRIATSLILSAAAGCTSQAPPSAAPQQAAKPAMALTSGEKRELAAPDGGQDVSPTPSQPDLVFRKAQQQVRAMEPLLNRRSGAQLASSTTPGSADPGDVKFLPVEKSASPQSAAATPTPPIVAPAPPIAPTQPPPAAVPPPAMTLTPPRTDVPFNKDTPAVNTPLIVGQPRPLPATDDMANRLAQQVRDYPQDLSAQFDWQLLQMLQGQSVPQLQTIAPLAAEDRELLSAVLDGLTNFRNAVRSDGNMLLSRKMMPLVEMSERLKTQGELSLPTVALCTDVKGFGVYDPIEPPRFTAGKENRAIVYCEVENFSSMLDEQKRWETKLTQEVVLYQESSGEEVWRDRTPTRPIVDYSRNRRHDFFIVKMIRLPRELTLGRFLLKVSVVDEQVKRVAENTVPIQIVSGGE